MGDQEMLDSRLLTQIHGPTSNAPGNKDITKLQTIHPNKIQKSKKINTAKHNKNKGAKMR